MRALTLWFEVKFRKVVPIATALLGGSRVHGLADLRAKLSRIDSRPDC